VTVRIVSVIVLSVVLAPRADAGLYYSGDQLQELPAEWRGYLPDQRLLRLTAIPANANRNVLKDRTLDDWDQLETLKKSRALTARELSDLGALLVRLGRSAQAVEVLRGAARKHPDDFALQANLGTAWQLVGDLEQAANHLEEAVRLAPLPQKPFEQLHLKLVKLRLKEPRGATGLDDLWSVNYVGPSGQPEANVLVPEEQKKLPADALSLLQQLALWLPADGRLLWQLAELANASGDCRTAASILDGCLIELGLKSDEARKRRQIYRAAAEELEKAEKHAQRGTLKFRSPRVFRKILNEAKLPKISRDELNRLPWAALSETTLGKRFQITTLEYLTELEGKKVAIAGFMVPTGTDAVTEFLFVENAVGCWYCEQPGPTQLIAVKLPEQTTVDYVRRIQNVVGTFRINRTDPESYLFWIENAEVREVE
jgi:hypothetical protein